ncbi:MAG: hypothetical protein J0H14_15745 [Alphaproteobacteria bacterium]|nr:hypothetical protein [Alphaproteobacteria bacterium]
MRKPNLTTKLAAVGAAAALALVGSAGIAAAQSPSHASRVIEVPPGAVVLVLPAGSMPAISWPGPMVETAFPMPAMPDMSRLVRQMDQMMLDAQHAFASPAWTDPARTIEAAMRQMPAAEGPVSEVVVTSFSDGRGTCTQRVVYSENDAAPKINVSSAGNACASIGHPTALPTMQKPPQRSTPPHTLWVQNRTRPIEVAQLR